MKGRTRVIDEHELASLIRKVAKVDWYEKHVTKTLLNTAKNQLIKNKTYHQYASVNDESLTSKYALQDNTWKDFNKEVPIEGEEIIITWDKCPEKYYVATYFDNDYIILANWNKDFGYFSTVTKVGGKENIKWKSVNV